MPQLSRPIRFLKVESPPSDEDASCYTFRVGQKCYPVSRSPSDPVEVWRCTRIQLEFRLDRLMFCVYAVPDSAIGLDGEQEIVAMMYHHTALCWVEPEDRERWRSLSASAYAAELGVTLPPS